MKKKQKKRENDDTMCTCAIIDACRINQNIKTTILILALTKPKIRRIRKNTTKQNTILLLDNDYNARLCCIRQMSSLDTY